LLVRWDANTLGHCHAGMMCVTDDLINVNFTLIGAGRGLYRHKQCFFVILQSFWFWRLELFVHLAMAQATTKLSMAIIEIGNKSSKNGDKCLFETGFVHTQYFKVSACVDISLAEVA
jgi:hypothetical protein